MTFKKFFQNSSEALSIYYTIAMLVITICIKCNGLQRGPVSKLMHKRQTLLRRHSRTTVKMRDATLSEYSGI